MAHTLRRRAERGGRGPQPPDRSRLTYVGVLATALAMMVAGIWVTKPEHKSMVIGTYEEPTTSTQPTVTVAPPDLGGTTIPAPRSSSRLLGPNGSAYGKALAFHSSIPIKQGLVFFLVVGSDARPGENLHKTRTDSLHIVAVDPATRSGTIVGIPRDTYVDIPGKGQHKINEALSRGGPQVMMQTVRNFTGLPVEYYVITAFEGFAQMVDELGGVDVYVPRNMDDNYSGAHFQQGYHHFNGAQALAFCRDRHDVPYGDFSRSQNQGLLLLAALAKMRTDVEDDGGLRRWLTVLVNHAEIDVPASELDALAALARRLDPSALNNVVMPGKTGTAAGGQSVVYPGESAAAMWGDLRDDARLTGSYGSPNQGSVNGGDTGGSDDTSPTTAYDEPTTTGPTTTSTIHRPIGGGGSSETTTTTASP